MAPIDSEFYRESVAAVLATPPEERSVDVCSFLAAHELLAEACAVLPSADPRDGLPSASREAQLVAGIKLLAGYLDCGLLPLHYFEAGEDMARCLFGPLHDWIMPVFFLFDPPGTWATAPERQGDREELPERSVQALEKVRVLLAALATPAGAPLERELAGVAAAGGAAPRLLSRAHLELLWRLLAQSICSRLASAGTKGWLADDLEMVEVCLRMQGDSARELVALQPDDPRSHYWLADVAVNSLKPAMFGPAWQLPDVAPAEALALLEEGEAAAARCKAARLPPFSLKELQQIRDLARSMRPVVEVHCALGLRQWDRGRQRELDEQLEQADTVEQRWMNRRRHCSGCGEEHRVLRECSGGCGGTAVYCRRALALRARRPKPCILPCIGPQSMQVT
eukprot:scaffold4.g4861.t1